MQVRNWIGKYLYSREVVNTVGKPVCVVKQ